MVLKLANSRDVGQIKSVPSHLDDFLNQYIDKTRSLEFAEQENKSVHPEDGKLKKDKIKILLFFTHNIPQYSF